MNMETMMAYCGLRCDTCPVYLATFEQDKNQQQTMRESIAKQCSELYGTDLRTEDITDCDGCRPNKGRIFSGCLNCEVRKCARQRNIDSCAFCCDYSCEALEKLFALDPDAKIRLEEIRQRIKYGFK